MSCRWPKAAGYFVGGAAVDSLIDNAIKVLFGMIVSFLIGYYAKQSKEKDALRAGLQAVLRDRMIQQYSQYYEDKHYMPIYAKDSFEACYQSYHNLGQNGVMDDIYKKVKALPTKPIEN